jgi:hypothetical protein
VWRSLAEDAIRPAIAFFYATGMAVGGITGPFLFGKMIESSEESQVAIAFFLGAAVMAVGGIVGLLFGVKAVQQSPEDIAKPLTEQDAEGTATATRLPRRPARSAPGQNLRPRRPRACASGVGACGSGRGRTTAYSPSMVFSGPVTEVDYERGFGHRARARGPRADRAARAGATGRRALLGPGPLPGGAARGGRVRARAPRLAQPLRPGRLMQGRASAGGS